jgi:NADH:ubiquinone oxidoreductase subunit E
MQEASIKEGIEELVHQAIEKHGRSRDSLVAILGEINRSLNYIPAEAIREIKKQLTCEDGVFVSQGQLYSLASFYAMYATQPRGRHVIKFCENAPCHVVGGKAIWDALRETLDLENGATTPDKKWTLVTTSCIGLCSVGPVLLIDDDMYGNVTVEQLPEILGHYE